MCHDGKPEVNQIHNDFEESCKPVSRTRRLMPQILAACAKNLLILSLSIAMNFPTIVIPVLRGIELEDSDETLSFTDHQATWFASIAYICQPIGATFSGAILEQIGRKKTMMVVNLPHIAAWIMLYYAKDLQTVFTADILLGLAVGFMEAPVITYVGEIAEPSVRGVLASLSGLTYNIGTFLLYTVSACTTWRKTALITLVIPITTIFCISMVPETPLWLLSKGRKVEAMKSLSWLRGWVPVKLVEPEFKELQRYNENSNRCPVCQKAEQKCIHPKPSIQQRCKELFRQKTLKPFFIIISCFLIANFSVINSMRPYYIQIFLKYNMAIDVEYMMMLLGVVGFIGCIICAVGLKIVGKRKMSLFSIFGATIFTFCLAVYSWRMLPAGLTSFDKSFVPLKDVTYTPIVLFLGLAFFSAIGISSISWLMISEIFPNKTRGMASGLCAAISYTMGFISAKTYLSLENLLSLVGVITFYTIISFLGFFFLYFFLPETEGKTLEEIEEHFSNNRLRLSDHVIKSQKQVLLENEK